MRKVVLGLGALLLLSDATLVEADENKPIQQCGPATPDPSTATLLKILRRSDLQKNEFENSSDYGARMQQVLGGIRSVRAIVPFQDSLGHYDADTEVLTIDSTALSLTFNPMLGTKSEGLRDWYGALLGRNVQNKGSYLGENAYGVKRRVVRTDATLYEVAFLGGETMGNPESIRISIPRGLAKQKIARLKAVVTGDVVPPYVIVGETRVFPTIDLAIEGTTREIGLTIKPTCGSVVDGATGETLANFDPSNIHLL